MTLMGPSAPPFKSKNKEKRHSAYLRQKKAKEKAKRDERFQRKRKEDLHPNLRAERKARNVPVSIDAKRVWDDIDIDQSHGIGLSVNLGNTKRQRRDRGEQADDGALTDLSLERAAAEDPNLTSFGDGHDPQFSLCDLREDASLTSLEDDEDDELVSRMTDDSRRGKEKQSIMLESGYRRLASVSESKSRSSSSLAHSTVSTNLSIVPDALAAKFPTLFTAPSSPPKILITTGINGTVHSEAKLLTTLIPNSHYIPRTRRRYASHHFSLREIAKYASHRSFTALLLLTEDRKRPTGLTAIHLPDGPTFNFTITSWVDGKKLPGHGNPTDHYPELILNNFHTPLGLLTASLFRTLFPGQPEVQGRQVVTMHNQRDYIFVRRHRYVFRDRRATERAVTSTDGQGVKGAEEVRAGLQELGPRFTLKLRRVDKGIQRASGQEWEWNSRMEKQRTKFQL